MKQSNEYTCPPARHFISQYLEWTSEADNDAEKVREHIAQEWIPQLIEDSPRFKLRFRALVEGFAVAEDRARRILASDLSDTIASVLLYTWAKHGLIEATQTNAAATPSPSPH